MYVYGVVQLVAMGAVVIGRTDTGVCWLGMGDDVPALVDEMAADCGASFARDDAALAAWGAVIVAYLDGDERDIGAIPLDVRGTDFQQRVWDALRAIPYGETRTYGALAVALGHPNGARAVGRACATNPVSLLIPCHRVQRTSGHLSGYRWGLERKAALITHEQNVSQY